MAIAAGELDANPWLDVQPPRKTPRTPRFLSRDEYSRLIQAAAQGEGADSRRFRYRFLVGTGARRGEAQAALWEDVDLRRKSILIRSASKGQGSTKRPRRIPLSNALNEELERLRPKKTLAPIFSLRNNWRRDLLRDCKAAGIRPCRIHDLRHTFASWLAQSGNFDLLRIRDLMGHSTTLSTEVYAHLIPGEEPGVGAVFEETGEILEIESEPKGEPG